MKVFRNIITILLFSVNFSKTIFIIGLLGLSISLPAQQSINSAGGDSAGSGQLSHSIGQLSYTATNSVSDESSMQQGVQIPYEFYGLSCLETVPTDMDVVEIGFGTANARVNATWSNPHSTTDCEVRGGRIGPSSIGSGTLEFANLENTRISNLTTGTSLTFELSLFNNSYGILFTPGQTYGFEVRCLCEDETAFTNWSGIIPEATFIVPAPPAAMEEESSADKNIGRETELSVYPNPNTGDEVMIVLSGLNAHEGMVQIEVLDMLGRHVQGESIATKGEDMSYSMLFAEKLPSGMYLVRVTQEGMTLSTRLVIE